MWPGKLILWILSPLSVFMPWLSYLKGKLRLMVESHGGQHFMSACATVSLTFGLFYHIMTFLPMLITAYMLKEVPIVAPVATLYLQLRLTSMILSAVIGYISYILTYEGTERPALSCQVGVALAIGTDVALNSAMCKFFSKPFDILLGKFKQVIQIFKQ